jgi:hypothetical protein
MKDKYPALFSGPVEDSLTSKKKSKKGKPARPDVQTILGIGLGPSSSSSKALHTIRRKGPVIDLSTSKLSLLDNPNSDPTPLIGKRKMKAIRKKQRESTKGPKWFGMTAPEVTDERKNDLEALKLRGALDTKSFYKRNTALITPKYFQVGKIVETKANFYNSRLTKKQRKRNIAEEFLAETL